jgi:hypothetical protein
MAGKRGKRAAGYARITLLSLLAAKLADQFLWNLRRKPALGFLENLGPHGSERTAVARRRL